MRASLALALAALAAACEAGPAPSPRYHLGEPYRAGGLWAYPREEFALDERGIAAIQPPRPGLTANGERREEGMFAAHRTLQLPAIVTVTNLETGRSLRLRVNDRGPENPARLIAVSPRAAALLGASGPFQARVVLDGPASRAAIAGLPGQAAALSIAAAPVEAVTRESLAPPEGARAAARAQPLGREAGAPSDAAPAEPGVLPLPERLPEAVEQGAPAPGLIRLEAGRYFRRDLAEREAARIPGARAEPVGPRGRQQQFVVRAGPYASLAEADAAFARAMAAGLPELRLVVE
ncbi:MAG: SPOR domain-containing protein [Roseococcus sp.]|nr:SPOR domain-containing protein [Roseococcus sp.]